MTPFLAAGLPLAAVAAFWLLACALLLSLQALWACSAARGAAGAVLRDMLLYGKAKEQYSPYQNVPKAWFAHFYVLGAAWHLCCAWAVLDGLWCWRHHERCVRHPPLLALLIEPPGEAGALSAWGVGAPEGGYTAPAPEELAAASLCLLLFGVRCQPDPHTATLPPPERLCRGQAHVWRRLAEECHCGRGGAPPSAARMHLAHYAFGLSFYIAAPLTLIADPALLLTLAAHPLPEGPPPASAAGLWGQTLLRLVGVVVFLYASVRQRRCHAILAGALE